MPRTIIDFIRHGEPQGGRRYRGHGIDDPLSDEGWRQLWRAVGDAAPWQTIISSPMQRCHAFAMALGERRGLPVAVERQFREVGFGAWEGHTPEQIRNLDPGGYAEFYADPVHRRPRNAEPLDDFARRVSQAFERVLADHPGRHVLVVAHAGVIRAVLGYVLHSDALYWYRTHIATAGISRFSYDEKGVCLQFHNCPRLPEVSQDGGRVY